MAVTVTLGDLLLALSMIGSALGVMLYMGRRIGAIEGWVGEARGRFDRIEAKVDRLIERVVA